jgi:hypothetical protein
MNTCTCPIEGAPDPACPFVASVLTAVANLDAGIKMASDWKIATGQIAEAAGISATEAKRLGDAFLAEARRRDGEP